MLEELKKRVCEQNLALVRHGLVVLTWGNVSARDEKTGLIVIKPSGVPYAEMTAADMVVTDESGNVVEGKYRPSSDLKTHLAIYKAFAGVGGVVHTHSPHAVAWAQAGRGIKPLGTTHADAFYGEVPCTRRLTAEETEADYEGNTGKIIVEAFEMLDPMAIPAVLVRGHGPFTWGPTCEKAVENAVTLEAVAGMATETLAIDPSAGGVPKHILDKHYFRKHGKNAYYGQTEKGEKD